VTAACGGLAVALNGIAARAWLLHGVAVLRAAVSYVIALGIDLRGRLQQPLPHIHVGRHLRFVRRDLYSRVRRRASSEP